MTTNNEPTTQEQEDNLNNPQDQDTIEATATVIKESKAVKKSSGGIAFLGLLIALGALALSAYNFYFYHFNTPQQQPVQDYSAEINSLSAETQSHQSMTRQQAEEIRALKQNLEQLQSQFANLTTDPEQTEATETVDLTPLQQQLETLQTELASVSQAQQLLQNSVASLPTTTASAEPSSQVSVTQFQNALAKIDVLEQRLQESLQQQNPVEESADTTPSVLAYTINKQLALAELYLSLDLPQAAIESLNTSINNESRNNYPSFTNQLERAVQEINTTAAVDSDGLLNQLKQISTSIEQLQLKTQQTPSDADSWYDKFITIRKVDNTAAVQSSTELNLLKSTLQHQLMLAQMALQTKNQNQWDKHLVHIKTGLQEHFAEQQDLISQVESLQQQQVRPQYPNIGVLIDSFQQIQQTAEL
ncbi:hypothetical protein [Marinicella sp. W31]|uniref:hypothetical protein n=1 Tax=Marinicella sp. W31 TaxID=3023713 RepID=UPI003757BB75